MAEKQTDAKTIQRTVFFATVFLDLEGVPESQDENTIVTFAVGQAAVVQEELGK
jgi:hypothetical protein